MVGTSAISSETTLIAATISTVPTTLAVTEQSSSLVRLSWVAPADTGGTPLTAYKLYWDQGDGNGMVLLTSTISALEQAHSVTTAHGLVSGNAYGFKLVAVNVVGDSGDSNELTGIIAAT